MYDLKSAFILFLGCNMTSYEILRKTMVDTQVRPAGVSRFDVIEAISEVPRELFVPEKLKKLSYVEGNINLGGDGFIIEPRILAKLLQNLGISIKESVIVVGRGCGYTAAVIGKLSELVVGVDSSDMSVEMSNRAVISAGVDNTIMLDGELAVGAPQHGPYDVLVVSGGIHKISEQLVEQVKESGRIAAFFNEGGLTHARIGIKSRGVISWRTCFDCDIPLLKEFEAHNKFVF